ncbi:S-layer homology domain-containing protein [Leptolyngbya cf. ectocarpi LEGE 11479]|uniref:S-layer homology domain-containing protein n=1 Tax=Leptolyngbya cf. ectocarpi LEGE 11479 TaxID=1828722 RepID=A0A928ZRZ5_LEPEC|nr:S-layer homology domain-containing protein [Leptolyngbya ectocarpi]MBE9065337.1 S-layer homology domain-containing protein [Leptolyngbya cf. ectocarpi LEGE 11479]
MSQIPSDPNTSRRDRRSLSYDELIALFVAFLTLGSVLFWGLTRSGVNLFGTAGLFNLDGAPPLVGGLGSESQLDLSDDLNIGIDSEGSDGEIGFGSAEALGIAGANNDILGDLGRSGKAAGQTSTLPGQRSSSQSDSQADVPAASATTPGSPQSPAQQNAQPATEPSTDAPSPEASSKDPNVAAVPTTQIPLEASREALQFQDVPDDYWAKPYIDALSERLVISGLSEETFAPDQPVSRAQLASAIAEAFPPEAKEDAIAFSDIAPDYWAVEPINKAVQSGFMNGFPDETFQPALPVPRAQVLTALVTGINSTTPENSQAVVTRYTDAAEIPDWAIGKMAAATQSGIVVNYPSLDALNPNQPATRAEVAAMIYQALAAQGRIEDIAGDYVVKP